MRSVSCARSSTKRSAPWPTKTAAASASPCRAPPLLTPAAPQSDLPLRSARSLPFLGTRVGDHNPAAHLAARAVAGSERLPEFEPPKRQNARRGRRDLGFSLGAALQFIEGPIAAFIVSKVRWMSPMCPVYFVTDVPALHPGRQSARDVPTS